MWVASTSERVPSGWLPDSLGGAWGWLGTTLPGDNSFGRLRGALQYITDLESGAYALSWPFGLGGRQQRDGQLLVKAEKVLHALALAGERLGAVAQVHRPVQFRMGFDQRRRH